MYYISNLVKEKKQFRPVIFKEAEFKMAAYIVSETGHTFGPSMLYPVYRSVIYPLGLNVYTSYVRNSYEFAVSYVFMLVPLL